MKCKNQKFEVSNFAWQAVKIPPTKSMFTHSHSRKPRIRRKNLLTEKLCMQKLQKAEQFYMQNPKHRNVFVCNIPETKKWTVLFCCNKKSGFQNFCIAKLVNQNFLEFSAVKNSQQKVFVTEFLQLRFTNQKFVLRVFYSSKFTTKFPQIKITKLTVKFLNFSTTNF